MQVGSSYSSPLLIQLGAGSCQWYENIIFIGIDFMFVSSPYHGANNWLTFYILYRPPLKHS